MSTVYDIIKSKAKNSEPNKLLASFSVYSNGPKLFDVTKVKSPSSINCFHGLRSLSIFWIIIGHQFLFLIPYGNDNDAKNFVLFNIPIGALIRAHPLAVDTFFVMGAILMTWSTLRDCEKKQLNILRMIWKRYLRYTPVIAAVILFVVAFSDIIQQGPLFFGRFRNYCIKHWFFALLHVQNYIKHDELCLTYSWYLSADFQLFIISPFIVFLIYKYGKKMLAIPATLCLTTIIYLISISIVHNIEFPTPPNFRSTEYSKYIYYVTHSRGGPWFLGMITGYYLYTFRGKTFKINKFLNAFLWIILISTLVANVYLQAAIETSSNPLPRAIHVAFISLHRNIWAIQICCIIFACQNLKTGGIERWFLSFSRIYDS
jgi:peptidoglycan/LPS O-acetylase OafA/YrhL